MLQGLKVFLQYSTPASNSNNSAQQQQSKKRKREFSDQDAATPAAQRRQVEKNAPAAAAKRDAWMTMPPASFTSSSTSTKNSSSSNVTTSSSSSASRIPPSSSGRHQAVDLQGKSIQQQTADQLQQKQLDHHFVTQMSKSGKGYNSEEAFDAIQTDSASAVLDGGKAQEGKNQKRLTQAQNQQQHQMQSALANCKYCFNGDNFPQHALISLGNYTYLSLPRYGCLVEGHCILSSVQHEVSLALMDENKVAELNTFKLHLEQMFHSQGKSCIFFETVTPLHRKKQMHTIVECIPVPKEVARQAEAYFLQAFMELESQHASSHLHQRQSKSLIPTKCERPLREFIPPNFPYFHVEYGRRGGHVHIIEEEENFPFLFAREVVCGMLDMTRDQVKTRSPGKQREAMLVQFFLEKWNAFDWTRELEGGETLE